MPLRIFIVEDEMINALSLKKELQRAGFQVCGMAVNSATAVAGVTESWPDLVLLDINLGAAPNGIETSRLIRKRHAVPIIFMTGYGDREIRRQAEALAPLAILDKPLDIPLLLELLEEIDMPQNGKGNPAPL
jgi:AmiR/NasT family two-component response regulator